MLEIVNPATQQVLRELPPDTSITLRDKFGRARAAQRRWAREPLSTRIAAIQKFKELLLSRADALAAVLTSEMGKPLGQARGEITATGPRIQFFCDHVEQVVRETTVFDEGGMQERISHEPLGVIGNISAWNYPYFVGSNVFIPALLTGNTVLYKPSEFATLTGLQIAELLHAAGVPPDAFIPVIGDGQVGAQLLEHDLAGVFFTGSYGTGYKIAAAAAKRLMKVQLELGGKDPTYVCEDVDVAAAAASLADGAFYNTGQSCCSVERIYVHQSILAPFTEHFVKAVQAFVVGDPTDAATYIGPLTRAAQIDVLTSQINDAVAKGGKVLCGGKRHSRGGNYFEPTVIGSATNSMGLMRDESFGPVIGIAVVGSDDEAVERMNDTQFGLTSGIYCRDPRRAQHFLAQMNSGSVYWNCCDRVSPWLPWTGRRHSGIGSTLSTLGIGTFTQPKGWHLRAP